MTLGHLTKARNLLDLLPSVDSVQDNFERQKAAMSRMESVCKSVITLCNEWRSNEKALEKARIQEEKAIKAQDAREKKKLQAQLEREQKKAAKARLAAEKAAAEAAGKAAEGEEHPEPKEDPKRRRVASKLLSEITKDDPLVLQDRFPEHQIKVVDTLDPKSTKEPADWMEEQSCLVLPSLAGPGLAKVRPAPCTVLHEPV